MKIAVVGAKGIPPKQGGIEHYCAEIYPRMVAMGHSVDLYARSSYSDQPAFKTTKFEGVQVVSLPCPDWRGADAFIASVLGAFEATRKKYDVVHFHALGPSLFTWMPKLFSSAKVVVSCHGLDWKRNKWGKNSSSLIRYGERTAVKFADEIIVVSKDLQYYFTQTYNRETIYIPNAPASYVDSDSSFAYVRSLGLTPQKYILFLGRLVPEKCPDLLIKAFQHLENQDWKLVLAGGNSDAASFASSLTDMSSDNPNIIFTGQILGQHLAEMVRGAGLFVLPSNLEGMPLALLEAMQEGIPVLASDIAPHRQLLRADQESSDRGILFKTGNCEDLVWQIKWAIEHSDDLIDMAEKARNYVKANYDWDIITNNTLQIYSGSANKLS
jgi:glycosyltransferase involved in cell wall biosynthesis